jgi:hypothetical protein
MTKAMAVSEALLERIAGAVEEQVRWTRFMGMIQLKNVLEQALKGDDDKRIYELSDGERSIRDIEKRVSASRSRIASLWTKWHRMHIMERSEKYGGKRMKRLCSLAEVGIDIPPMPEGQATQESSEEEFE